MYSIYFSEGLMIVCPKLPPIRPDLISPAGLLLRSGRSDCSKDPLPDMSKHLVTGNIFSLKWFIAKVSAIVGQEYQEIQKP